MFTLSTEVLGAPSLAPQIPENLLVELYLRAQWTHQIGEFVMDIYEGTLQNLFGVAMGPLKFEMVKARAQRPGPST